MRRLSIGLAFWFGFMSLSFAQINLRDDKVTVEEVWMTPMFYPDFPNEFRWMLDDQYYSVLEKGEIARYSIADEKKDGTVLDLKARLGKAAEGVESYTFGPGEKTVLLTAEGESIYRRSSREKTWAVDLNSDAVWALHEGKKIGNATYSPDGKKVAYTYENDLFYFDTEKNQTVRITKDGKNNAIINGSTDWVYEEEFAFVKAFWWSPDSRHIGYIRFDESKVPEFTMSMYGQLYPDLYTFKYPKAGEVNAEVSVRIYNLSNQTTKMADLGAEKDIYVARMTWASDSMLAAMRLNRLQNELTVLMIDAASGKTTTWLTEKSDTYINEVSDDKWHFLKEGKGMLWMSEVDGYNHLYHYDMEGNQVRQITEGDWAVSGLASIDEENEMIYYMSTEVSPLERHLYAINFKGKKKKRLTEEAGFHDISFSSANSYYEDTYSTEATPPVSVLKSVKKGEVVKTLVDNARLNKGLERLNIAAPEFFTFTSTDDVSLNGWMIKPADFDNSKQYPVLMFVYGGPGSQEVKRQWDGFNYGWHQSLAQQGYIVACVDNRGTGGRGRDFRAITYGDLGKYETIDQIEAAKYLGGLDYVDKSRIGIWGWSYGGYMTALCLTKGDGLFKAGISVAPVTNWRFYDTIYTERYLKTPQLNPEGYDKNSPINFVNKLKGSLLLVHGTGDDNVHYQNSLEMVNALVNANKQFDMAFYPNKNHGIYGGYTRYHLFKKMTDFVLENL
ncbi:MAG: S9 family peptidase [Bacteroidota bacterium]